MTRFIRFLLFRFLMEILRPGYGGDSFFAPLGTDVFLGCLVRINLLEKEKNNNNNSFFWSTERQVEIVSVSISLWLKYISKMRGNNISSPLESTAL